MERYSSYIVYPLVITQHKVVDPLKQWMSSRATLQQLQETLATLESERDALIAEVVQLRSQLLNIDDTKMLVESNKPFAHQVVCNAQIIAKNFSQHEQFFLIDAGSNQGITTDMTVIAHNCLLGKVSQVYPWYSKIIAITDATCKVAACCYKTKTAGIHEGINNIVSSRLNFVSHLDTVQEGDYIFSSGEGLIFPRGLAIGYVTDVTQEGLYHMVNIKPLADLKRIKFCSVLHKGAQLMPLHQSKNDQIAQHQDQAKDQVKTELD